MPALNPIASPEGVSVASGAILLALLDALIAKGLMSKSEIREVVSKATLGINARIQGPGGVDAAKILGELMRNFAQN
jgi:hypothetical protein